MINLKIVTAIAALSALAGCVIEGPGPRGPGTFQPTGIEGSWQNTEGLYNARFGGQSLTWTDTQTGATLVTGSYTRANQSDYSLMLNSQATGRTLRANCRLANINTLNCTREDGQQFSMIRLAA